LPAFFLAAGPFLAAQEEGFEAALKFRGGFQIASIKDRLSPGLLGAGLELGYQTSQATFAGELGFSYKPGSQYLLDPASMPVPKGVVLDPGNCADSRKNQLDGYFLRLSCEKPFLGFAFRAGVEIANATFRQEYIGDLQGTAAGAAFRDSYNGVLKKRTVALSPFIGAKFELMADQYLEVQVLALGYTSATYVHVAGTGTGTDGGHTSQDALDTSKRILPHLEFAWCIRF
jgi:hypothetical protein